MKKIEGINKVAIIGAGLMGYGIGVDFVRAGYPTWLYNTREETSRKSMERARKALGLFVEAGMMTAAEADKAYGLLHPTTSLEAACEGADYISESVSESLALKRKVFADMDRLCPPSAILTTNSSNFTTTRIVSENEINHPERCCVAHYFQPPHLLPWSKWSEGKKPLRKPSNGLVKFWSGAQKKPVVIPVEVRRPCRESSPGGYCSGDYVSRR